MILFFAKEHNFSKKIPLFCQKNIIFVENIVFYRKLAFFYTFCRVISSLHHISENLQSRARDGNKTTSVFNQNAYISVENYQFLLKIILFFEKTSLFCNKKALFTRFAELYRVNIMSHKTFKKQGA